MNEILQQKTSSRGEDLPKVKTTVLRKESMLRMLQDGSIYRGPPYARAKTLLSRGRNLAGRLFSLSFENNEQPDVGERERFYSRPSWRFILVRMLAAFGWGLVCYILICAFFNL